MRQIRTSANSLVSTKLFPPTWDERAVQRLGLFACGRDGRMPGLFSVVAAAGSGKSTLMSQLHRHMQGEGRATAWISLDQEDNDLASFSAYFVAALKDLRKEAGEAPDSLGSGVATGDPEALCEVLLSRATSVTAPSAIFLDDFQNISDRTVLRFMDRLIAHLPEHLCLVLASRTQPALELGRLRVSGRLREVDQDQLRFGPGEAAEFLKSVHGIELGVSDLTALMEATEGWAAGLQLAALALLRQRGPAGQLIREFSGRDRDLMSYLGEGVLNSQPAGVKRFLLWTGPLRRMCPELCQAVSEHPKCGEMLALLDRSKLFMVPLDRNGRWFRYHHLFGEFLRKSLQDSNPEQYQLVCERAALWCEANGLITEAIQYSLDIGQYQRAADMIADRAFNVAIKDGDHYTILDWMRRLPKAYHFQRPEIVLCHAWSLTFSRDPELGHSMASEVLECLAKGAESGWTLNEENLRLLQAVGGVVQAVGLAAQDRLDEGLDRALPLCEEQSGIHPAVIGAALCCVTYSLLIHGDLPGAVKSGVQAIRYGRRADSIYVTVWAHFLHGMALLELGEVQQAREDGKRAQAIAESGGDSRSFSISMAALLNAEVETTLGNFEAARDLMETGRTFALLFGPVEPLNCAFLNDARISARRGDMPAALSRLAEGREIAEKAGYDRLFIGLAIEEARLLLYEDRVQEAASLLSRLQLAERINAKSSSRRMGKMRTLFRLVEAEILCASGSWSESLNALSKLQYALGPGGPPRILMKLHCAKSIALWRLERWSEAMRELDKALAPAIKQQCFYPIIAFGSAIKPVLESIRHLRGGQGADQECLNANVMQRLLSLIGDGQLDVQSEEPAAPEPTAGADVLTGREIELLRMAERGLSNKKLAKQLLISEATVKWHMHNIYSKLGVENRTSAAARARELRFI